MPSQHLHLASNFPYFIGLGSLRHKSEPQRWSLQCLCAKVAAFWSYYLKGPLQCCRKTVWQYHWKSLALPKSSHRHPFKRKWKQDDTITPGVVLLFKLKIVKKYWGPSGTCEIVSYVMQVNYLRNWYNGCFRDWMYDLSAMGWAFYPPGQPEECFFFY